MARVQVRAKPRQLEAAEQRILAQWLDFRRILWCHVPNGGARNVVTGAALKAMGVKPGVPDVLIFDPPPIVPESPGVCIEMKAGKGKPSAAQLQWIGDLVDRNWLGYVCNGADDAIEKLKRLGYG